MLWRICGMMRKLQISRIDARIAAGRLILRIQLYTAGCAAAPLLLLALISCTPAMNTQAEPPDSSNHTQGSSANAPDSSTHTPGSSTHTPVSPPADEPVHSATVYIDSAGLASDSTGTYIRIDGHLPTPCHHLAPPEQGTTGDTLRIVLNSWQKKDVMCAQVLEPFVYYMKIASPDEPFPAHIFVNGERAGR